MKYEQVARRVDYMGEVAEAIRERYQLCGRLGCDDIEELLDIVDYLHPLAVDAVIEATLRGERVCQ